MFLYPDSVAVVRNSPMYRLIFLGLRRSHKMKFVPGNHSFFRLLGISLSE